MIINKTNIDIKHFHNANVVAGELGQKGRRLLLKHLFNNTRFINGEVLEFGVFKGKSLHRLSKKFKDQKVYGFDSFEGLPEDWIMRTDERETNNIEHPKGHFDTSHINYNFQDNVVLVKGFFDESLPKWLNNNKITQIKFLHIDSDLYSSAKTIFDNLNKFIVPGTVILFDELYPWSNYNLYDLWEEGEWKALVEWVNTYNRSFKLLARNNHQQVAIQVI